ncbi:hypothetical protein FNF27_03124 [Cafeteria roenbergensis]|uniref:Uncharacterized protein n=1 Tax=Cafeteria roenbergensis TaxID=33653 RepID=A0A5A8EDZ8_CAFRO|nr:hypothetical protein FNF27_03124 [Cafeteria roenbergensis]
MADDVVTLAIATAAAVLSGSPHEDALIRDLAASASDRPDAHACLKRLERTVGKHYCALWTQCRRGCQYADRQHAWRAETDCWLPFSEASLARAGNKGVKRQPAADGSSRRPARHGAGSAHRSAERPGGDPGAVTDADDPSPATAGEREPTAVAWEPLARSPPRAPGARVMPAAGAAADGDPSPAGMAQLTEALLAAAQAANRAADSAVSAAARAEAAEARSASLEETLADLRRLNRLLEQRLSQALAAPAGAAAATLGEAAGAGRAGAGAGAGDSPSPPPPDIWLDIGSSRPRAAVAAPSRFGVTTEEMLSRRDREQNRILRWVQGSAGLGGEGRAAAGAAPARASALRRTAVVASDQDRQAWWVRGGERRGLGLRDQAKGAGMGAEASWAVGAQAPRGRLAAAALEPSTTAGGYVAATEAVGRGNRSGEVAWAGLGRSVGRVAGEEASWLSLAGGGGVAALTSGARPRDPEDEVEDLWSGMGRARGEGAGEEPGWLSLHPAYRGARRRRDAAVGRAAGRLGRSASDGSSKPLWSQRSASAAARAREAAAAAAALVPVSAGSPGRRGGGNPGRLGRTQSQPRPERAQALESVLRHLQGLA